MNRPVRRMAAATATMGALALSAQAAEPWTFVLEPYAMFPNMEGQIGIGNQLSAEVSQDPSDIFDKLQIGAMLYVEARSDHWAFSSDLLFMDLEADADVGTPPVAGIEVGAEQLGWELAALRRVTPEIELGVAATYNKIKSTIEVTPTGGTEVQAGLKEDWIDPSLVVRARLPLRNDWSLVGRANIGGFGVGSDLFWQIQAHATYKFSERMNMSAGYRFISVDYDHGSGPERFVYDMNTFGPVLRFAWLF